MTSIWLAFIGALKSIFLKVVSQKFFEWLFFWAVKRLVEHTKTKVDDEFLKQIEAIYNESNGA